MRETMESVLRSPVLVLNKHWQAFRTATVLWALRKVFAGRAVIVGEDYQLCSFDEWINSWEQAIDASHVAEERLINSADCCFVAPEVVRTTEYGCFHTKQGFSRRNVFLRDNNTCQYCGRRLHRSQLNIDHVIPKSRGGRTTWENIALCCIPCNSRKGHRTPREAGMQLLRKPTAPHWSQLMPRPNVVPRSWEKFLGQLYWDIELQTD